MDEPASLKPNAKVMVLATDAEETEVNLEGDFSRLSESSFRAVWDNPLDADYDHL